MRSSMAVLAALIAAAVALHLHRGALYLRALSSVVVRRASLPPTPISYIGVFETGAPPPTLQPGR